MFSAPGVKLEDLREDKSYIRWKISAAQSIRSFDQDHTNVCQTLCRNALCYPHHRWSNLIEATFSVGATCPTTLNRFSDTPYQTMATTGAQIYINNHIFLRTLCWNSTSITYPQSETQPPLTLLLINLQDFPVDSGAGHWNNREGVFVFDVCLAYKRHQNLTYDNDEYQSNTYIPEQYLQQ